MWINILNYIKAYLLIYSVLCFDRSFELLSLHAHTQVADFSTWGRIFIEKITISCTKKVLKSFCYRASFRKCFCHQKKKAQHFLKFFNLRNMLWWQIYDGNVFTYWQIYSLYSRPSYFCVSWSLNSKLLPRKYFSSTAKTFFQFKGTSASLTLCFLRNFINFLYWTNPSKVAFEAREKNHSWNFLTIVLCERFFMLCACMKKCCREFFFLLMVFNFTVDPHFFKLKKHSTFRF